MPHPSFLDSSDPGVYVLRTTAPGPKGRLPLVAERLRGAPSGNVFGLTQNAGMGWDPRALGGKEFLILSTQGGIRAPDGTPVALGYHTGHWEVGLLMEEAAAVFARSGAIPFAGYCSDPCDGRTNGTPGMFDSLPYRNDAAILFRRLIRSLPTARGVLGIATCDKGLPAMMMALAGTPRLPAVLVPGGVTLLAEEAEDTAKVQTLSARFAQGEISLEYAAEMGCKACGSPGGGCQFMGTAATSQVVGEALVRVVEGQEGAAHVAHAKALLVREARARIVLAAPEHELRLHLCLASPQRLGLFEEAQRRVNLAALARSL